VSHRSSPSFGRSGIARSKANAPNGLTSRNSTGRTRLDQHPRFFTAGRAPEQRSPRARSVDGAALGRSPTLLAAALLAPAA